MAKRELQVKFTPRLVHISYIVVHSQNQTVF